VKYVFQFGPVLENLPRLLLGAWLTVKLSAGAMLFGTAIAVVCAFLQNAKHRAVRFFVRAYVEFTRNTPFLIQLFIIYFSLPALGQQLGIRLRLDAWEAALIGMSLNLGAYATEIVRGGIDSVARGQIEAGAALGLRRFQIFRLIVLRQAIKVAFPALASQFVLLMLGSSIISAISVEELTGMTNTLQSTTFRSFEFYFAATCFYLVMAFGFRAVLGAIYWLGFVRGRPAEGDR